MNEDQALKDKNTRRGGFLKWYLIVVTILIVAIVGIISYASTAYYKKALPNTYLLGKNIGGFNQKQIQDYFSNNRPFVVGTINLKVNDKEVPVGANDIGVSIDLDRSIDKALNYQRTRKVIVNPKGVWSLFGQKIVLTPVFTIDEATFDQKAREFLKDYEKAPVNASIAVDQGRVAVKPDTPGTKIDTSQAAQIILKYLPSGKIPIVNIKLVEVPADVPAAKISGIKDYLATHLPSAVTLINNGSTTATMDLATIVSVLDQASLQKGTIKINQAALNSWVNKKIAAKINVAAKPIKINALNESEILDQGQAGKTIDQGKLASDIAAVITNNTPNAQIQIAVTDTQPDTQKVYPGYTPGKYSGRYIEINLAQQTMYAFEGTNLVYSFSVSSGKWSTPTPEGEFSIINKTPRAYSAAYGLYMPWWQAIDGRGDGIHELPEWPNGAKEGENHIGTPVSHGCIRLGVGPAKAIYDFTDIGTPVYIHR